MNGRAPHEAEAAWAIDELVSNGAVFHFRPASGMLPSSFTYEVVGAGDRRRCRQIVAETKSRPMVWAALLRGVAARSEAA